MSVYNVGVEVLGGGGVGGLVETKKFRLHVLASLACGLLGADTDSIEIWCVWQ